MFACRIFTTLESLPIIPAQQVLDSLTSFLSPTGDGATAPEYNRVRLLAKLQHNVQWVADNIDAAAPTSRLCTVAAQMLSQGSAVDAATAG